MIKVNTTHIPQDGPLLVEGVESTDILQLASEPQMPMVPEGDIRYQLFATMAGQDLLVTGIAEFMLKTECSRCLEPITVMIRAGKICLLYEQAAEQEKDLTSDIREELLLSLPQYFYCQPDCKGLCPGCGADLNHEKCRCNEKNDQLPDGESPWGALDSLK